MTLSREFGDLAAAGALAALLFATGMFVPVVGPAAGFFSSAPLIWVAARHGPVAGILGGLLGLAALLPGVPPPLSLIFALEHALPAWFLGWRIARGRSLARASALAAVVVTALVIGAAYLLAGDAARDPISVLEEQLRTGLAELDSPPPDATSVPGAAPALPANFAAIFALLRRVLPAVTLIGVFFECSLNSLLATRLLARSLPSRKIPDLAAFTLPEGLVWVLIPLLALSWWPRSEVATIALNLLLPLLFGYLLQGLSILLHLARRARLTRFARVLFALSLLIFPWLLAAPLLLGLFDFRVGFRARWPLEPPPV